MYTVEDLIKETAARKWRLVGRPATKLKTLKAVWEALLAWIDEDFGRSRGIKIPNFIASAVRGDDFPGSCGVRRSREGCALVQCVCAP